MPFRQLGLHPLILKAIADVGYVEPTPIQTKAIPLIRKGGDVVGIAQTGTGKTAAYIWPLLERLATVPQPAGRMRPRILVLVPTRELAFQVEENFAQYARHTDFKCAAVFGGVSDMPQIRKLRAGVDFIVATPGRLIDLMSTLQAPIRDVEVLVLDEADRMLDMGFIPDVRHIVRALPFDRQTLFFSATFSKEIETVAREFLREPQMVEIGRRATPIHTTGQFVYEVSRMQKLPLLAHLLKNENLDCVLVFARTREGADRVAEGLIRQGIPTGTLHSDRRQSERMATLRSFKSGQCRVLVATDIAARGIDVDGISHVVNFDFPAHPEDYVHRIGRTGRASAIGDALSLVSREELRLLQALERFIGRGIPRRELPDMTRRSAPVRKSGPAPRAPAGAVSPAEESAAPESSEESEEVQWGRKARNRAPRRR